MNIEQPNIEIGGYFSVFSRYIFIVVEFDPYPNKGVTGYDLQLQQMCSPKIDVISKIDAKNVNFHIKLLLVIPCVRRPLSDILTSPRN